jgi:uncharacterized delta-60 repeat protein
MTNSFHSKQCVEYAKKVATFVCFFLVAQHSVAAPGELDISFGTRGKVTTSFGDFSDGNSVAIQLDGKIVAAGYCYEGMLTVFCVSRYLANGSLDTSFNGSGKITSVINGEANEARSVAVQGNGKIFVGGNCYDRSRRANDFCIARYNSDGTPDNSFGADGKVITQFNNDDAYIRSIVVQTDGKLVAAGYCSLSASNAFCLARYNSNGTLDAAFGVAGRVISQLTLSSLGDDANGIALQSDGKILVAGQCALSMCVARYNSDGSPDNGFGTGGNVVFKIGEINDKAIGVGVQTGEGIVVGGICSTTNRTVSLFCATRYTANGVLDASFGVAGVAKTPIVFGESNYASSFALQPDDKVVMVGSCNDVLCLVRYNANGSIDTSFGNDGKTLVAKQAATDNRIGIALQSDGKIVTTDVCFENGEGAFCVLRFQGAADVLNSVDAVVPTLGRIHLLASALLVLLVAATRFRRPKRAYEKAHVSINCRNST